MKNIKNLLKFPAYTVCIAMLLTSCLKNKGPVQDYSQSPALVGFQFTGNQAIPMNISVLPISTPTVANIEVTLSVASLTLSTPVTLTVNVNDDPIKDYNAANPDDMRTALDPSTYSIPDGGKVTISPGQQIVTLPITLQGDKIDFGELQALGLKITDVNGAVLATNLSSLILLVNLQSPYEDNYATDGVRTRYNGATESSGILDQFAISGTYNFSTLNANTVVGQLADPGSGGTMALTVNSDNTVTISNPPGGAYADLQNDTGAGASVYDPATKTFTIFARYHNAAGALRTVQETLVGQ